jgi:hypothetical protein
MLGAALIDSRAEDAQAVLEAVATALPRMPILLLAAEDGQDNYAFAQAAGDSFAVKVLALLRARPRP